LIRAFTATFGQGTRALRKELAKSRVQRAESQARAAEREPRFSLPQHCPSAERHAEEQKEVLHFVSLLKRDSGSGIKITVICHLDCSLYIDFRI